MKITIRLKSFNLEKLKIASIFIKDQLSNNTSLLINGNTFDISNVSLVHLPKKISKITILKSPHIDKKARHQYGMITYNRSIVVDTEISNSDTFTNNSNLLDILSNKLVQGISYNIIYNNKFN